MAASPSSFFLPPVLLCCIFCFVAGAAAAATEQRSKNGVVLSHFHKDFNYAASDCGAKILDANPDSQHLFRVLNEQKDLYSLSPCSSPRWYVVELCQEVGVTSIELANFEFFSSTFKDFTLYGSHNWPTKTWIPIGHFVALNVRQIQYFSWEEPVWFRYVKVEFKSHHGDQYYCPLSVIRVHGTSHVHVLKEIRSDIQRGQANSPSSGTPSSNKKSSSTTSISSLSSREQLSIIPTPFQLPTQSRPPTLEPLHRGRKHDMQRKKEAEVLHADIQDSKESIFATLAKRVEQLRFNQSLHERYLDNVSIHYANVYDTLKMRVEQLTLDTRTLSSVVEATAALQQVIQGEKANEEVKAEVVSRMMTVRQAMLHKSEEMVKEWRKAQQRMFAIATFGCVLCYILFRTCNYFLVSSFRRWNLHSRLRDFSYRCYQFQQNEDEEVTRKKKKKKKKKRNEERQEMEGRRENREGARRSWPNMFKAIMKKKEQRLQQRVLTRPSKKSVSFTF
ncbi:SUN domain-containing protein [Balamuthia mandrillaris]